jgi:hypothetical protein
MFINRSMKKHIVIIFFINKFIKSILSSLASMKKEILID